MLTVPRVRLRCSRIRCTLHSPLRLRVVCPRDTRTHLFSWKRENPGNGEIVRRNATDSIRNWYAPRAEVEDSRAEKGIRNSRRFVFIQWLIFVLGRETASPAPNQTRLQIEFRSNSAKIEDWGKIMEYECNNYDFFKNLTWRFYQKNSVVFREYLLSITLLK